MVLERELLPFSEWLWGTEESFGAIVIFLIIAAVLGVASLVIGFLLALVRHGPTKAGDLTYRTVSNGARELFFLSPRRVWALARLAVQESIRRRVIVVFVVYMLILLFAGWFLHTDREPARLYFSFVLTATTYLVLALALLLSTFSLPGDIKSKTIYTIVTKPVRAGEIVLGRMVGFTLVGTVLLAVMGIVSYVFVVRAMDHTHTIEAASLQPVPENPAIEISGRTTNDADHRHAVTRNNEGDWLVSDEREHYHFVEPGDGEPGEVEVSGPRGHLQARVPMYAEELRFLDRSGGATERGISVGKEWGYRSFIDGNTAARAIWTFGDVSEAIHPDGLPVMLITRVFRTHKGEIEQGIQGQIYLRNPETGRQSEADVFTAKDDQMDDRFFPRKLKDTTGAEIDLYDDLVSDDGQIEVWVRCVDPGQYFGYAHADCFLELQQASPLINFWKAQISIWVQMVLVIAIGVACSTFVSGPVALLFTVSFIVLGMSKGYFVEIAEGTNYGGGPVESIVRMVTQMNQISPLAPVVGETTTSLIKGSDAVIRGAMAALAHVLPDFTRFDTSNYVAEGFNIPADQVGQDLMICLAYVLGLFVAGYFFLRTREIAK